MIGVRFADQQMFWWLVPWALSVLFWWAWQRSARKKLERFADPVILPKLLRGYSPAKKRVKFILGLLAVLFAIIAAARPQRGSREEYTQSQGLDILFLLDVSNSMLAEDVVPSRLKKAHHIIRNFVDRLSGDRAGIVAFAGSAYPAVPLTTDYEFVRQTLDILDEHSIANQGTDLAHALEVGFQMMENGAMNADEGDSNTDADDSASRVVVIVSDGESHEGGELKIVPELKKHGIRVYTIGVGSLRGAPIPVRTESGYMEGYRRDQSGNMVLTKLESDILEKIAAGTGGKFYAASSNEGEVQEILDNLNSLERTEGQGRKITIYEELFQYPLAIAVFFFLLQFYYREAAALALVLLFVGAQARAGEGNGKSVEEYRESKQGMRSYSDESYTDAIDHFGRAQAEDPDSVKNHLNLGDALLKGGDPKAAIPEFEQITKNKDANQAARGYYNLGKAYDADKNRETALRAYQQGLERLLSDPKPDPEVLQRLKRALEVTQQQKQSGQDEDKDKKEDQDQDKNKQNKKEQDDKKNDQNKQYKNPKPQFKDEKMNESDAKRILRQLQEQEKKTQQEVMRGKTARPKEIKNPKDW